MKDQSRNWQKHFLRVEQERCAQSSRIDELLKLQVISYFLLSSLDLTFLQYTHPQVTNTSKQKYDNNIHRHAINSAPSSLTTKGANISSPTEPPSYKSAAHSTSDMGSCSDASSPDKIRQIDQRMPLKRRRDIPPVDPTDEAPHGARHRNPSSSKRKNKGNDPNIAASSSSQRQDRDSQNAASHTTLIRRVQAVVHIKREESDDDVAEDVSGVAKDEASDEEEISSENQRRSVRRRRKIIKDDEENVEQNYLGEDGWESRHLRHRNGTINYREEDEDDDDVDELLMGAEVHII